MKDTTESWIQKAKDVHGSKYDYSLVNYIDRKTKILIICNLHGSFPCSSSNHLHNNSGCPECKKDTLRRLKSYNTEIFIQKAISKHGNRYDYSMVNYIRSDLMIKIICFKHGIFKQTPACHLFGQGCKKCAGFDIYIILQHSYWKPQRNIMENITILSQII